MTYQSLEVTLDAQGVAHIALNAPEKRNALSAQMMTELAEAALALGGLGTARAVVLSGRGAAFCAGADLDWMQAQIGADRPSRLREARRLADMLQTLNTMPVPLIGRIHGVALGGGVGLACVCDVVVAARSARFGLTETRLGLIPATISAYVVARMGEGRARQVFFSGRVFDATEAERLGIVSKVVEEAELDAAIAAEVTPYLSVAAGAVGRAKELVRALGPRIDATVIDDTISRLADAWETDEAAEGIAAFLEKRAPSWAR